MKAIIASILITGVIIGGAVIFVGKSSQISDIDKNANNVSIVDQKQIISIGVKGGYFPRISNAKADMPTILRFETNSTFDCSAAVSIPSLKYRTNLKQSGITEIEIPPQKTGATIQGLCAMGMHNFKINFNN